MNMKVVKIKEISERSKQRIDCSHKRTDIHSRRAHVKHHCTAMGSMNVYMPSVCGNILNSF